MEPGWINGINLAVVMLLIVINIVAFRTGAAKDFNSKYRILLRHYALIAASRLFEICHLMIVWEQEKRWIQQRKEGGSYGTEIYL